MGVAPPREPRLPGLGHPAAQLSEACAAGSGVEEEERRCRLRAPRPPPDLPGPARQVDGSRARGEVGAPGEGGAGRKGPAVCSLGLRWASFLILEKGWTLSSWASDAGPGPPTSPPPLGQLEAVIRIPHKIFFKRTAKARRHLLF